MDVALRPEYRVSEHIATWPTDIRRHKVKTGGLAAIPLLARFTRFWRKRRAPRAS